MGYPTPNVIQPYWGFNLYTPALPQFYWNVKSAEQRIHHICKELHKIAEYANYLGENVNIDHVLIEQLQDEFDKFKESGFLDYYKDLIQAWMDENLDEIVEGAFRMVFFGLTDDGYFCAYVPDSWNEIRFDTGAVYGRSDYGRLILQFTPDESEASGTIDNTYNVGGYSAAQVTAEIKDELALVLADLETAVRRTDYAFNTLYTNLDEVVSDGNF